MNSYEEQERAAYRKAEKLIAQQQRRRKAAFRTTASSLACAAALAGIWLVSEDNIRNARNPAEPDTVISDEAVTTEKTTVSTKTQPASTIAIITASSTASAHTQTTAAETSNSQKVTAEETSAVYTPQPTEADKTTFVSTSEPNITSTAPSPVSPSEPTEPPPRYMSFKDEDTGIWYSEASGSVPIDIAEKMIGEQMLTNDEGVSSNAALYAIKEIAPEAMIAVQFDGTGGFTLYRNMEYMPDTLGDFIDDTGINAYAVFGSAEYADYSSGYELRRYYGFDTELIISFLRDCADAVCYRYSELTPEQVNAKINLICDMNKAVPLTAGFGISKKGYLTTNLTGGGLAFYIGEDKAEEIISAITENYPYTF